MKIEERVVIFSHESPLATGCGKVYNLASTDLIHYPLVHTASFELAHQAGPGELHEHHLSDETYICIGGKGFIEWGTTYKCVIKEGDVFNIIPRTFHALNAEPDSSVEVLVVSYPRFTPQDLYKIVLDSTIKRRSKRPSFYIPAPKYGILLRHAYATISRLLIEQPYTAAGIELLFVIRGSATCTSHSQPIILNKYDSIALEKGDTVKPHHTHPVAVIRVQLA